MFQLKNSSEGSVFLLYVQPGASKNRLTGTHDNSIKLAITAPPVDGKANKAVIKFFSIFFKVPKSAVLIKKGEKSRYKQILIKNYKIDECRSILHSALDNIK
jgi:uncharacterized protein